MCLKILCKPFLTFCHSGDDHDYCESNHSSVVHDELTPIREVTVKSLSMAMGIQKPGFQLLSLAPHQYWQATKSAKTYADAPCLLPGQLEIYLSVYAPFFAITLLALFISNLSRVALRSGLRPHAKRSSSTHKLASRLRSGACDDNQMSDEDSNSTFRLPLPASQLSRTNRNMPFGWAPWFRRTKIRTQMGSVFANPFLSRLGRSRRLRKRTNKSLVRGFVCDIRDVAVSPLILFMSISLWMYF